MILSFREYIEAFKPSPQGFSFGGGQQNQRRPNYQTGAYRTDVARGHAYERGVVQGLQTSCGWKLIANPTALQDMRAAIDSVMETPDGQRVPVQIKARKSGTFVKPGLLANDIGYEVAKDFGENDSGQPPAPDVMLSQLDGRDMGGSAVKTVVLGQDGKQLFLIDTQEGKDLIQRAAQQWVASYQRGKPGYFEKRFTDGTVSMTYKFDDRDRYWKIVAYIPPRAFKSLQVCELQNSVDTSFRGRY